MPARLERAQDGRSVHPVSSYGPRSGATHPDVPARASRPSRHAPSLACRILGAGAALLAAGIGHKKLLIECAGVIVAVEARLAQGVKGAEHRLVGDGAQNEAEIRPGDACGQHPFDRGACVPKGSGWIALAMGNDVVQGRIPKERIDDVRPEMLQEVVSSCHVLAPQVSCRKKGASKPYAIGIAPVSWQPDAPRHWGVLRSILWQTRGLSRIARQTGHCQRLTSRLVSHAFRLT